MLFHGKNSYRHTLRIWNNYCYARAPQFCVYTYICSAVNFSFTCGIKKDPTISFSCEVFVASIIIRFYDVEWQIVRHKFERTQRCVAVAHVSIKASRDWPNLRKNLSEVTQWMFSITEPDTFLVQSQTSLIQQPVWPVGI